MQRDYGRRTLGAALVLSAASLWASLGIFTSRLYDAGFAPLELASVRTSVGFAAVALLVLPRRAAPGTTHPLRVGWRAIPFLAAYGVLGYALFTLVFFAALERTTVAVAVALLYTAPAFVLLASVPLWHERITRRRVLTLALVLAGVVLVTGAAGAVLRGTAPLNQTALLFGLGAGATYAGYTIFSKIATERYGPASALFWSFACAAVVLALLAPPHRPFLRAPEQLPLLLGIGIVPTLLPYALYLRGLRELRASTAAMLATVEPMIAALLAAAVLGQRLHGGQAAGMILIVVAAVLLARRAD